jgi:hypothetical protein
MSAFDPKQTFAASNPVKKRAQTEREKSERPTPHNRE